MTARDKVYTVSDVHYKREWRYVMDDTLRTELKRFLDSDDLVGLALRANAAAVERYYPAARHATLVIDLGEEVPTTRLTVHGPAASEPVVARSA